MMTEAWGHPGRCGRAGLVIKHPAFYVDVVQLDFPAPKARVAFAPSWRT
jgi:hypothetical protein